MQALEACDNKMLKIAFHLAFTATLRIGELLGLTWDEMDISEEAIANNRAYVIMVKFWRFVETILILNRSIFHILTTIFVKLMK